MLSWFTRFSLCPLCALWFILSTRACTSDDRPQVVAYVSADDYIAREAIDAFEKQSGIRVQLLGDSELSKTTGLVERLRSERDNPQCDVFWSSEVLQTIALAEEGVLEPFTSAATSQWPAEYRDAEHRWYGFAARARVIVYAPDRVQPQDIPRTWMDLTKPMWKGRLVMADPRFGTTGGHFAAMYAFWEKNAMPGYYAAFLEGLAYNEIRMLTSGNAGAVEAVARGEADAGMTDTDDVWAAQARGLKVDLVYPAHDVDPESPGAGTLLIPNTVARVKGGPNPPQAAALIDFLLSEEVERMLAESVSHNVPLRPELADRETKYQVANPLRVDFAQAALKRIEAIEMAMRILPSREPRPTPREEPDQEVEGGAATEIDVEPERD